MLIYIAVLTVIGSLSTISLLMPKSLWRMRIVLSFIANTILVIFVGLRDHVGADWDAYADYAQAVSHNNSFNFFSFFAVEPLYAVVNYFASIIGGDIHIVNLICAIIMLYSLSKFAYLCNLDICTTLFLAMPYLIYSVGMGYTRQGVAIGLSYLGIGYWTNGMRNKALFCIFCACGFHYSAVFVAVLIYSGSIRKLLACFSFIVVAAFIAGKASGSQYFDLYIQNTENLHSSGVWLRLAMLWIGIMVFIYQHRRWKSSANDSFVKLIEKSCILVLLLTPVAIFASTLVDRISLYLSIIYLASLSKSAILVKPPFRFLTYWHVAAFTYGCFFLWFSASPYVASAWLPYRIKL